MLWRKLQKLFRRSTVRSSELKLQPSCQPQSLTTGEDDALGALSNCMKEIEDTIKLIREVENQANLLALNAEVDLARSSQGGGRDLSRDFRTDVIGGVSDLDASVRRLSKKLQECNPDEKPSEPIAIRSKGGLTLIKCR